MRLPIIFAVMLIFFLGTAAAGYEIDPSCGYCGAPMDGQHADGCPQGGYSSGGDEGSNNDAAEQAEREMERDRQQELAAERERQEQIAEQQRQQAEERERRLEAERERQEEAEHQRQEEAERRQEVERRQAAERQRQQAAEAERQHQREAGGRRTGIGPYIRTIHVPYPPVAQISWQKTPEVKADRPPLINLSPEMAVIIGTIAKSIKEIPGQINETVLTYLGERAGADHTEDYISILTITKGYADNATAQIDRGLQLIRGGSSATEVNAFLRSQDNQAVAVLNDEFPLPPSAEDEAERAAQGYSLADKFNRMLTGAPEPPHDHPIPPGLQSGKE